MARNQYNVQVDDDVAEQFDKIAEQEPRGTVLLALILFAIDHPDQLGEYVDRARRMRRRARARAQWAWRQRQAG